MKTNTHLLYEKLKELDLSVFKTNFPNQIQINPNVKRKMMFIGTEFERAFTSVLSQKYGLKSYESRITIEKKVTKNNSSFKFTKRQEIKKNQLLNLDEYLDNFDFFFKKRKSLNIGFNEDEIDETHIKQLLKKINYEKFKPKKIILTKINLWNKFEKTNGFGWGEIDLIIDDKIVDIKIDTVLKLNKDYVVQLLFYYLLLNYSLSAYKNSKELLSQLKIKKLCLYYASFDILVEFEINKIFTNENVITEIDSLIHTNLMNYNFNLREVIRFVVFNSKINEDYFEETLKKSNEKQLSIFKSHIDYILGFNFDIEANINIDFKSDFLIQIIKINLALLQLKKIDSISKENKILILEYLMNTYRNSVKKTPVKKLHKLNNKHLFMGLKDYSKINVAKNNIHYYRESFEKKEITKSIYEENSDSEYGTWNNLESENEEEFEKFLKNINLLYLEFYNQKTTKTITNAEFKLIRDLILELLEYEIKSKEESDFKKYFSLLEMIGYLKDEFEKSLWTKKEFENHIHILLNKFL